MAPHHSHQKKQKTQHHWRTKNISQLSLEEAFFLSYSLGVLNSSTTPTLCSQTHPSLSLFRRHSYFPPRSISAPSESDDPFMISYAVYHHYRWLGWVVRSGVKFVVDYLLYNRGPAFSVCGVCARYSAELYTCFLDSERGKQETCTGENGLGRGGGCKR